MTVASISDSAQRASDEVFTWLPKLVGALVILLIGYVLARIVARLVRRGLTYAGIDRALDRGTAAAYKTRYAPNLHPSGVIATIAFWFVFGSAILLAITTLGLQALQDVVGSVVAYLPNVVAAVLIMVVAIAIAGAIGGLTSRLAGGTVLARMVQTIVPTLVLTIALFMALVQLKIATQIVVATYILVLGAIALGFALAFGLGGRDVAARMLESAYVSAQQAAPVVKEEMRVVRDEATDDLEGLEPEG